MSDDNKKAEAPPFDTTATLLRVAEREQDRDNFWSDLLSGGVARRARSVFFPLAVEAAARETELLRLRLASMELRMLMGNKEVAKA